MQLANVVFDCMKNYFVKKLFFRYIYWNWDDDKRKTELFISFDELLLDFLRFLVLVRFFFIYSPNTVRFCFDGYDDAEHVTVFEKYFPMPLNDLTMCIQYSLLIWTRLNLPIKKNSFEFLSAYAGIEAKNRNLESWCFSWSSNEHLF